MARSVSVARRLKSSIDWSDLPEDLLDAILSKLSKFSDFIRFGTVCKSFQSVAENRKLERRVAMRKEPPFLVLVKNKRQQESLDDSSLKFEPCRLYNIKENKVYNHEFKVPLRRCDHCHFYSSRCWLIKICNSCKIFELYNPFTEESIQIPRGDVDRCTNPKVLFSCDPTTSPDDFVVCASCSFDHGRSSGLGLKKFGQPSWKFFHGNFRDMIFHNGLLYAVEPSGSLLAFDYKNNDEDELVPTVIIPRQENTRLPYPFLVEASTGDLLLLHRKSKFHWKSRILKRVNKEIRNSCGNDLLNWVETSSLENNDSIFSTCPGFSIISACCISDSEYQNRIYFTHNYGDKSYIEDEEQISVFHLKDGTHTEHPSFHGDNDYPYPLIWITPTLC